MAFDILYLDRRDLTARPLRDRRVRLEDLVAGSELIFPVRRLAADAWRRGSRWSSAGTRATSPRARPS
jgi:ATP-dependent DNA ligase